MLKQWKAFILAVVLLCRLLPLPSAAAAGSVLDALTAEMLTDEVACCITKDLNLPTEINGVSVSWESSNRAVIAPTPSVNPAQHILRHALRFAVHCIKASPFPLRPDPDFLYPYGNQID